MKINVLKSNKTVYGSSSSKLSWIEFIDWGITSSLSPFIWQLFSSAWFPTDNDIELIDWFKFSFAWSIVENIKDEFIKIRSY